MGSLLWAWPGVVRAAPSPDCVVVFNEIQYNPAGPSEAGEWVELFNQMGIKVDLSGWRLAGGIDFTIPARTIIDPGGYLVIAKSPGPGQLGPFGGNLDNGGEQITLINHSGRFMDSLAYGDDGRWPVAADGSGATLAKRDPYTANKPPEHWTSSADAGGTPGTANFPDPNDSSPDDGVELLAKGATWRVHQSGLAAPADWAADEHPAGVGGWEFGPGILGYETRLSEPIGTELNWPGGNVPYVVTSYFESEFNLTGGQAAGLQSLRLRHLLDDGAVFYLNGVEIYRANMPTGAVGPATFAASGVEAVWSPVISLSPAAAVAGPNRISVEVHQESATSGDLVFGLELDGLLGEPTSGDVSALRLNELPAWNVADYWIELVNTGSEPAGVGGMIVSAEADPQRSFVLPARSLGAGTLLVLTEQELGFRPADGENVFLHSPGGFGVLDGRRVTGRLRGRSESKGGAWLYPDADTPGAPNTFTFHDEIVISEVHYHPPALPATPGGPATTPSEELFGIEAVWRYNDGDENLPVNWAATAHAVGGNWKSGGGPIGWETGTVNPAVATNLTPPINTIPYVFTYYFEREFTLTSQQLADLDTLQIVHQVDDGAVVYLNGVEVARYNMPGGAVGPETAASTVVRDAVLQTLPVATGALVAGSNRISVEVHQVSNDSTDVLWGMKLEGGFRDSGNRTAGSPWIEIANRSATSVDLGGWEFDDGIAFTFPAGTVLAPGEHACVAGKASAFTAAYPGARLLGEFGGSLSRSGERLSLRDASKNPADEVRYFEEGRWPQFADGGGSSLELRDLRADNNVPEAWADSDETHQATWKSYSYRAFGTSNGGPHGAWRDFVLGMLQAGEILLDDISVVESPDSARTQFLSNTDFETGSTGWRLVGNHRRSRVITDPDDPGNKVLHIVSEGATEHMHNHIETTLLSGRNVRSAREYEISFRAKWLTGSSQLHTRLYFNRVARHTPIDRPLQVGTPSALNSRAEANIGPTFTHFLHAPAVPRAHEAVTVTARASDPDGVAAMVLNYVVGGRSLRRISMTDTGGGLYRATIPGQSASAIVQFYLEAADGIGAASFFPALGPDSRAQYKVQDGLASTTGIHNFRIVMQEADADFMHTPIRAMSNGLIRATVIDREEEIYYDVGVRLKGGERARTTDRNIGYRVRFDDERRYRGVHRTVGVDRSGENGSGPGVAPTELMFDLAISNARGSPSRYTDLLYVIAPRNRYTGPAMLEMARYNDVFLDSQYEDGSDGHLYEYELIYYPHTADANGFKIPQPDSVLGQDVGDLGPDEERYRWFFLLKNNRADDNFEPIIRYNRHFGKSGAAFEEGLEEVIDVDGWFRGFGYAAVVGSADNISAGFEHNGMYYAQPDGRVVAFPHDMENSWVAGLSIWANPECARLTQDGGRRRIYLGHLHDIVTTTFNQNYMAMWSSHLNELDPASYWEFTRNYMNSRANNVLSQINNSIPPVSFRMTTSDPHTVNRSTATISGKGWIEVRDIRVAGNPQPLEVTWTDSTSWQAAVPAVPGRNRVTLEALNFSGEVIATDSIVIDNTSPVEPAAAANLAITELMYHPADPAPAEMAAGFPDDAAFEYVEVMNIGTARIDLTGVNFAGGISFAFPSMTLPAGGRAVVARNRAGFLSRHPQAAPALVAGEYGMGDGNKLANGGEEIVLNTAGGALIRRFTYGDAFPWPESPDGRGPSLVLIAPETNPDHAVASNWRPSASGGGAAGRSDATVFTGDPGADPDRNGLSAFLEYAIGTSRPPVARSIDVAGGTATFTVTRNLAADDVLYDFEVSTDLFLWNPGGAVRISSLDNGDGTATETWRTPAPIALQSAWFARLALRQRAP